MEAQPSMPVIKLALGIPNGNTIKSEWTEEIDTLSYCTVCSPHGRLLSVCSGYIIRFTVRPAAKCPWTSHIVLSNEAGITSALLLLLCLKNVIKCLVFLISSLFCRVAPGFESMKDQYTCNKIMAKLIQDYRCIFEEGSAEEVGTGEQCSLITVKVLLTHYKSRCSFLNE